MNILQLKEKVNKGIALGAEVVYIKEDSLLFGIDSIVTNKDDEGVVFIKSTGDSLKSEDFINIIDGVYNNIGNVNVYVGKESEFRNDDKPIDIVEFAQYENIKMLFLNA